MGLSYSLPVGVREREMSRLSYFCFGNSRYTQVTLREDQAARTKL